MRGTCNFRFLIVVTACSIVLATGWFFLHRYQRGRQVGQYLTQVTRAEEEHKLDRAARLMRAYILASPADTDARIRYGGLLETMARTPKDRSAALSAYEQALRQAPDRPDARRRAAELALELNRPDAALGHLTVLAKSFEGDGRVLFLTGRCQEMKGRYQEAVEAYARSGRADPKPEAFVRRAGVLRVHLKQEDGTAPDGAETGPQAVLNELVAALPNAPEAYLARAAYRKTYDKERGLTRARADLETARRLAPNDVGVLLASAHVAAEQAATAAPADRPALWQEARDYLRSGLTAAPKEAALYLVLADVEVQAGRRDAAVAALNDGRKAVPANRLPDILFALAEQHAEAGDRVGTDEAVAHLRKLKQDPVRIDYLLGVSLVRQRQWFEGSGMLERVRPLLAVNPERAVRIDLLLAQCYGQLGDIDRQLVTYRRAVSAAPLDYRPRYGLAGTLAALGRTNEAIGEYRHLTKMTPSPAGAWLALARLMVYHNLSRPVAERQWDEVNGLIAEVKKASPDAVEVSVLEAEVLVARGDTPGARTLLTAARDARPAVPELWFALSALIDRTGDNGGAHAVLDEARRRLGDSADLRIARLQVTAYASVEQSQAVIEALSDGTDAFPPDDRARLLRSLAAAYWQLDRPAAAGKLWAQVAVLRPTELAVRLFQFDAALRLNDEAGMQRVLSEIGRIDGGGALEKYGAAVRLIWRAGRGDRAGLGEARDLLTTAAARRPGWSRVPLAQAQIDELEGNAELMLEHLKQAVELGERRLDAVKRVVQLLDERGRTKEADNILVRLESQAPISTSLQRLAAEVSLRLDIDRAVTMARRAVGDNAKDYKERVWLGRILSAAGRTDEADNEFEAAVKVAGERPEVWTAFVQHTVRRKGGTRVADVVRRADAALARTEPLAVALCYDLGGQRDEAERRYLAAIKAAPDDVRAVRATATFYQQTGTPAKAEPFLRQLVAAAAKTGPEGAAWARRNLALAVGLRAEGGGFDEAMRLLDANAAGGEQVDDLRTRALVTATRPGRRAEVIALLEKAERLKPPAPEHEFLLAKLYEAEGQWPKARERLRLLAGNQKDNTAYLEALVRGFIRWGEMGVVQEWLDALVKKAPHAHATVTLQTQVLCRTGRAADAVAPLRKYAGAKDGTPTDPATRALTAADLLDQCAWSGAGNPAATAAEEQYTKYRELSKRPDAALPLAAFYGRHGAPGKALALCDEARKGCPVEQVVANSLTALASGAATDAHFAQVEGWLNRALVDKPNAPDVHFLLGAVRDQQGRHADAEAEYRKVLTAAPDHAGALNELALLLALTGRGPDAVKAAQRAAALTPVVPPELLDTRGTAFAAAGDLAAARRDFEAAVAESGHAGALFHLAAIHAGQKEGRAKAMVALQQARNAGLRPGLLHPLERPTYARLAAELKP